MAKSKNKQTNEIKENSLLKDYYFIIIPILITFLIYSFSLTFGLRDFDEDSLIKNSYVNKTLTEYIEKFFLCHIGGVTDASGFTFSGIKNVHVSFLGIPTFYTINYCFKANPFLFHAWSLGLHLLALYFFTTFCFKLTNSKSASLFSGLFWTLHPTNVEPIIWATNWAHLLGACFYFYTLRKILSNGKVSSLFLGFITLIQILFTEHTVTIPIAIFLTVAYKSYIGNKKKILGTAFKTSLPSLFVILSYTIIRFLITSNLSSPSNSSTNILERVLYFSPQIFTHQIKLLLFPLKLSIDQLDLLKLDPSFLGNYNIIALFFLLSYVFSSLLLLKQLPFLSYGLVMYFICLMPFLQIIPFYSIAAERYNYFSSAFFIVGLMAPLFSIKTYRKTIIIICTILCLLLGLRSKSRILNWQNSETLFQSAAQTSNSFLKKGIWTYDLAISTKKNADKNKLLNYSTNLLKLYIKDSTAESAKSNDCNILKAYELDKKSLLAKAALRIATNYQILNNRQNQFKYLKKGLQFSRKNTQVRAQIHKDLGTFYFKQGDFTNSIQQYLKSTSITPNPSLDFAIAICYSMLNDSINYENYLKKSVSIIVSNNISPFKAYGQYLELTKKDFDSAIQYYRISSLLENTVDPYILLSSLYMRTSQIEQALKFVNRGLYGFPQDPSLNYFLGTILIYKKEINEGMNRLIKVAEMNNTPADIKIEACNILTKLYIEEKKFDYALKYTDIVLSIDPLNKEALSNEKLFRF